MSSGHSGMSITTDLGVAIYRSDRLAVTGSLGTTSFGANYSVSDQWALVGNVGYSKLLSDAKSSPIVTVQGSSDQFFGGLWAVYSF